MNRLFWKSVLAFLALPGVVAFAVPLLLIEPHWQESAIESLGLIPLLAGTTLLLWCVREFYVSGRGTLAPWSPPRHLVESGLYRFSRNPMYVAVLLVLLGWAITFRSWGLAIYALAVGVVFHLRVVLGEEPWLSRTFGDEWIRYKSEVPRWIALGRTRNTVDRTR